MRTIQVGNRRVGDAAPALIIAEIGVNHDGSLPRALQLVQIAADCGADAIKLQIFRADRLMHRTSEFAAYQQERVNDADPIAMLRRYELDDSSLKQIVARAQELNLLTLATPFSIADVATIEKLQLPAIKIASPDCVNQLLIERAMQSHVPLLISTGAATIGEVGRCIRWTESARVVLLHCISSYPVELDAAHLAWIPEMAGRFGVPIGYSDHASDERCGAWARAAGACVIEKHITYDRDASGPDHAASADPEMFRRYVQSIRDVERAMGVGRKRVLPAEADVRRVSRQSLVTSKSLQRGDQITADVLTTQRPGTGISAAEVQRVVGRRVLSDLPAGTMLNWEMVGEAPGPIDHVQAA